MISLAGYRDSNERKRYDMKSRVVPKSVLPLAVREGGRSRKDTQGNIHGPCKQGLLFLLLPGAAEASCIMLSREL